MKNLKISAIALLISLGTPASVIALSSFTAVQKQQETVHIEGMGITKTVRMNGGTLHIEGANNTITVTGSADKIMIEGANVRVKADAVNYVRVEGANVLVQYTKANTKSGLAKSEIFGAGSKVVKIK